MQSFAKPLGDYWVIRLPNAVSVKYVLHLIYPFKTGQVQRNVNTMSGILAHWVLTGQNSRTLQPRTTLHGSPCSGSCMQVSRFEVLLRDSFYSPVTMFYEDLIKYRHQALTITKNMIWCTQKRHTLF